MTIKARVRSLAASLRRKIIPPKVSAWARRVYHHLKARTEPISQRRQSPQLRHRPVISLLIFVNEKSVQSIRETIESVRRQTYPYWELCVMHDGSAREIAEMLEREAESEPRIKLRSVTNQGEAAAMLNNAFDMAEGEFVARVMSGDTLARGALFAIARLLNEHSDADMIYTDEDVSSQNGLRTEARLKPDWSPEYLLSCMYTCHLNVYRTSLVAEAGAFREGFDGACDYDLTLRVVEKTDRIHHIPQILYHEKERKAVANNPASGLQPAAQAAAKRALNDYLERNRINASCHDGLVAGLYRVRHRIMGDPLVSIIIPTAGLTRVVREEEMDLLANCVRSIVAKTEYGNYEILCVDNGDLREETKAQLDEWGQGRVRTVTFTGPFNIAEKMNVGATHAKGEHFLFLNDDIEVLSSEWLTAMLEFSQQKGVGAVGAKLYFPDGTIQHAGVRVFFPGGAPGHLYYKYPEDQQQLIPDINAIRNYSAVTGACMMTRRDVFEEVKGFTEEFPVNYNDIDYCLKVRAHDYRVVYTPYAELFHFESVSRVAEQTQGVRPEEMKLFTDTWERMMAIDPYHNRLLDPLCFKYYYDARDGDSA